MELKSPTFMQHIHHWDLSLGHKCHYQLLRTPDERFSNNGNSERQWKNGEIRTKLSFVRTFVTVALLTYSPIWNRNYVIILIEYWLQLQVQIYKLMRDKIRFYFFTFMPVFSLLFHLKKKKKKKKKKTFFFNFKTLLVIDMFYVSKLHHQHQTN